MKQRYIPVFTAFLIFFLCLTLFPASASAAEATDTNPRTITGFVSLPESQRRIYAEKDQKPDLADVIQEMPETLEVFLDGGTAPVSIPVSWFPVGEDYEASESYYFQFSPRWNEADYVLAPGLDLLTEAPYVGVFFSDGSISLASVTGSSNETEIFNFLVDEIGLNHAGACGVLANMYRESSFNPLAVGDNGTSHGICQWHNARWTALVNWCKEQGLDPNTLTGQLNYLKFELSRNNSNYLYNGKTIFNYMTGQIGNNADGAFEAGRYWCYYYEVPANKDSVSVARGNLARDTYWPEYEDVVTPGQVSSIFPDVMKNDWFYTAAEYAYLHGIMTGTANGNFEPYASLPRAQAAVILHRMEGSPSMDYRPEFSDIPANTWYTNAILWAQERRIMTGYSNGSFGPADFITREQLATILYRYAESKGLNTVVSANLTNFVDYGSVSDFAKKPLEWAVGAGIISGKTNGTRLDPQGVTTRAEASVIFMRFLEY